MQLSIVYAPGTKRIPELEDLAAYNSAPLSMGFDRVRIYFAGTKDIDVITKFYEGDQFVIVQPGAWRIRGFTYPLADFKTGSRVVTLSQRGLNIFLWFKGIMAKLVLKHEFGHVSGLEHHPDPICIMCPVNASFGRFCTRCTHFLDANR